ncbi:phytanoyl-CoA dioxygenase family protein [Iamia majanohamensis]|uniref:Phytanoyl-CoA dioxygenase family protein n=1 Tax=Iamia majanohamensis TaxID=467976 RepID=A0AAF0BW44_9ACTN|nr:phytanoyl-CoA dioxygenase family protein [Iamia majanohamensis]WCO66999.1 phytanoyl-CoA dioxygenase family protein [Iamia majanohamensis]
MSAPTPAPSGPAAGPSADHDTVVAALADDGCAVVPDLLGPDEVARATAALEEVFASEADVAGERGWRTDAYRVAYALPAKDPTFLDLCTHSGLGGLADAVLGPDCVVAGFNGQTMVPGGTGQRLHRDHPVPTPGTTLFLHLVCALDAFTPSNGATRVVPGTHREPPADDADLAALEDRAVVLAAPAGAAVAFDATLVHAAGANATGAPRRALHVFFARPWVQPHWDLLGSLAPEVAADLTADQRRRLGGATGPRRFDRATRTVLRPR